jgi:hypothetical protein
MAGTDMGRFTSAYRLAADPTLPIAVRYVMFIQVCSAFGGLARSGMQPVYNALGQRFGFSCDKRPDALQLTQALNVMVEVRFRLLHLLASARLDKRRRTQLGDHREQPAPFTTSDALELLRSTGRPHIAP